MVVVDRMIKPEKNYYEVLGIEENANPQDIKRAYFGLVRQFPPERFPEEFKELRTAYDTLLDEKRRAEYDKIGTLPEEIKPLFYQAQKADNRGRYAEAMELYHTMLQIHPELPMVQEEYARTLEETGKNGKAIEVWKHLCEQEPANARYAFHLAKAYDNRGWGNKAQAQFRQTLELDRDNCEYWLALINHHGQAYEMYQAEAVCREAMEAVGEKADLSLYLCAFSLCGPEDIALAGKYLQNIIRLAEENNPDQDRLEMIVTLLTNSLVDTDMLQYYPPIKKLADKLQDMDDEVRENLERAERNLDNESLPGKDFNRLFYDLFVILNNDLDSPDDEGERMIMECEILSEPDTYRPQLIRLKNEYPQLYDLHRAFFDEVLRTRDLEKMLHLRIKRYGKRNSRFIRYLKGEGDDGDSGVQTVRRESPKIGRNDPCPCGSGKKYKLCHGR
jgi:curved DNA-binding protein CbpA